MKRIFLFIVLIMIIVFGVSSISLALENPKIVEVAKKYEGVTFLKPKSKKDPAGQCKWFVQKTIREAGGKLAAGYRYCYLDIGFEISANDATAGDIIQLDDPNKNHNEKIDRNKNGKQDNYTPPMHTAIVLENLGNNKFKVVDSNRIKILTVAISDWNPYKQAGDKLDVHFYRLGDIPQPPLPPQLPKEEQVTAKNITAVVGIDDTGSMFYNDPEDKRLAAAKFFIDLMSSGDKLSIFKFGVTSKFYHSLVTLSDKNKERIRNSLYVNSNEGTDMDLAFNTAFDEIENDKSNNPKYFILLTDGAHRPKMDMDIPYKNSHKKLWDNNYKIYGIFLRSPKSPTIKSVIDPGFVPDPDFLKNVCGEKDGKGNFFEAPTNQNLQQIYSEISKQVQGQKTAFDSKPFLLKPDETKELSFVVPKGSSSLQVITNWQGSTFATSLYSDGNELIGSSITGPNYQIINIEDIPDIIGQSIIAKVKAVDVSSEGEEARLTVRNKLDETLPIVSLSAPEISRNPTIKISANDNIGINKVSAYFIKEGSWRKICSNKESRLSQKLNLGDGIYTVKAEALDKAGNQSSVYQNIVIDKTKPVVKYSLKNPSWISQGNIKITAEDPNFKSLEVKNGKKITALYKKNCLDLKVDSNDKIFIKATDKAGNIQTKTVLINNSWWQLLKQSILDTFHIISVRLAKLS
ncbi:hypothetical protein COX95_04030 [bacterium CG_4_10_14_0_2_um_filter_33_32]|nr:MAG: hypothetical protein AUJ93_01575 [bacterium CG2_30_33_46]PIR67473.1 MAG: hypothetical protein COU50_02955 [bacterium CG10_big_fil_rev_8_21_14_0_10_33_18]PIU76991.1 MAG: hypothetical protein COS74_01015 [bacterium CG06_land_8_20_14_3_00_33_50]PIW81771.1 MAG: hypothetical protein COZ97_00170 [bacterium CG_4_8_14_3_um_filter_33_28]PIY85851.1 MAG: hypothetical protein COY76_00145 [bacterium CG_4_10_14_0_8_um_filter_33_57]PIZ85438.1 MAG: hypothetical protein COX95_04030 [bacterium CG_4_10_1